MIKPFLTSSILLALAAVSFAQNSIDPLWEPLLRQGASYTKSDQLNGRARLGVSPIISGNPWYGQVLTSTIAGQWYAGAAVIAGETGLTLTVPSTLPIGTVISQVGSNSLTIADPLDAIPWVIRLQTQRGPETTAPFVSTGASVSTWLDQYGTSGRTATASPAPMMQINNNNRVARFTGSQKLTIPTVSLSGDLTVTCAFQPSSVASAGRNLVEGGGAGTYIQIQSSTSIRIKSSGGATLYDLTFPRSLTTGRWYIISVVVSSNVATVYVNGQPGTSATLATTTWNIQNFGEGIAGDVGAILVSNSALNSTQRDSVRKALGQYQTRNFYVSSNGSDSNNGFTATTPFATIAKAISVGLYPGDTVWLRSGDEFYELPRPTSPWAVGSEKITFRTTAAAKANVLGSNRIASTWTVGAGTEYSTPLAYTPRNAFWVQGGVISESSVVKLTLGTAGSLTVGQYAYSSGNLIVNIGINPTGERIEVPKDGNTTDNHVFYMDSSYHCYLVDNLGLYFGGVDGFFTKGRETVIQNSSCHWNGEDGIGTSDAAELRVLNCRTIQNGGERTTAGGRGDGISAHGTGQIYVEGCYVWANQKGGITNLQGVTSTVCRNLIGDNNLNGYILVTTSSDPNGVHTWYSNIIVVTARDQKYGINRDGNNNPSIIRAYNNTIYCATQVGTGIYQPNEARGNVVRGFSIGIAGLAANGTTADSNCVFGASTPYFQLTPGAGSITTDPLFLDISTNDFRIARGSGCYGTGPVLGIPNYDGLILNPPNIGAK